MLKPGTKLTQMQPQAALAMALALDTYRAFGLSGVVTSCYRVGAEQLLHSTGCAFDLRLPSRCGGHPNLSPAQLDEAVVTAVRDALGGVRPGSDFDVVLERFSADPSNDHVHIEYDPKS